MLITLRLPAKSIHLLSFFPSPHLTSFTTSTGRAPRSMPPQLSRTASRPTPTFSSCITACESSKTCTTHSCPSTCAANLQRGRTADVLRPQRTARYRLFRLVRAVRAEMARDDRYANERVGQPCNQQRQGASRTLAGSAALADPDPAQFEPEETATHSSSIVDLIDSCKAPVDFILRLKWPNEYEHAKFLTGLSRVSRRVRSSASFTN